jgi:hypothetical protein
MGFGEVGGGVITVASRWVDLDGDPKERERLMEHVCQMYAAGDHEEYDWHRRLAVAVCTPEELRRLEASIERLGAA